MVYVTISILMAIAAVAWLIFDLFFAQGSDPLERLVVKRYAIRVWDPTQHKGRTDSVRARSAHMLL